MGATKSRLLYVGGDHTPRFAHFKTLIEIAPGFWNVRAPFFVMKGAVNIGTHMSILEVAPDQFVALDAVEFTSAAARAQFFDELNELTNDGENLVAVITTHPFHTLAIPSFHAKYPSTGGRTKWYGCPRHLRKISRDAAGSFIEWAGDLNDCAVRRKFEPALRMSIPEGCEFIDPQPPTRNHLSCVLVLHTPSRTVHVDDCLCWIENMGALSRLAFGNRTLHFHPSLQYSGLYPTAQAPLQFKRWATSTLVEGWDYERLATAHNGVLRAGAKAKVTELLAKMDPALRKLSIKNAHVEAERAAAAQWDGLPVPAAPHEGAADDRCQDCWSDVEIECG